MHPSPMKPVAPLGSDSIRILDVMAEGVLITDAHLQSPGPYVVYVNAAFERLTGWRREEIVGRTPRVLQGPETDLSAFESMHDRLGCGEAWEGRAVNYRRSGQPFVMEWSIAPLPDLHGAVRHYLAVQRDVTERIEAQQRLETALRAAHDADRAKLDFLAMMSHELRTPLNAVIGYAELLMQTPLSAPDAEHAKAIGQAGHDLLAMVGRLLAVSRSGLDASDLREEEVDVGELVQECIASARPTAELKGVTLSATLRRCPRVRADLRRLRQAIHEALDNGIKFNRSGGRVDVVVDVEPKGVRMDVVDDGPGMTDEAHQQAFALFSQGEPALTRRRAGVGLGLCLIERFVTMHGGEVALASRLEQGTCLRIWLPEARLTGPSEADPLRFA